MTTAVDAAMAADPLNVADSGPMDDALASALATDDWQDSQDLDGALDDLTSDSQDPRLATAL